MWASTPAGQPGARGVQNATIVCKGFAVPTVIPRRISSAAVALRLLGERGVPRLARKPGRGWAYHPPMDWNDAPWIHGALRITRAALADVERDAVAGYRSEQEACGYLAGPAADALLCDRAVAIENMAKLLHERDPQTYFRSARTFFAFKERTLEQAMRAGVNAGVPVKVLYHSHIDVGAYLSGTDQAVLSGGAPPQHEGGPATLGPGPAWPLAFLVTSVRGGPGEPHCDDHRLFIWQRGGFAPSPFEVV